jgi:hypothetical protein
MLEVKRVVDRETLYEKYVNPQWVRLLDVLQMNVEYTHCIGAELHTMDGPADTGFHFRLLRAQRRP